LTVDPEITGTGDRAVRPVQPPCKFFGSGAVAKGQTQGRPLAFIVARFAIAHALVKAFRAFNRRGASLKARATRFKPHLSFAFRLRTEVPTGHTLTGGATCGSLSACGVRFYCRLRHCRARPSVKPPTAGRLPPEGGSAHRAHASLRVEVPTGLRFYRRLGH